LAVLWGSTVFLIRIQKNPKEIKGLGYTHSLFAAQNLSFYSFFCCFFNRETLLLLITPLEDTLIQEKLLYIKDFPCYIEENLNNSFFIGEGAIIEEVQTKQGSLPSWSSLLQRI